MLRRLRRSARCARAEVALLGTLALMLLRFLRLTTRMSFHGMDVLEENWRRGRPMVLVAWHGRITMLPFLYRGPGIYILNSTHRDGEIITRAVSRLGINTTRGSSTRRAVAGALGVDIKKLFTNLPNPTKMLA